MINEKLRKVKISENFLVIFEGQLLPGNYSGTIKVKDINENEENIEFSNLLNISEADKKIEIKNKKKLFSGKMKKGDIYYFKDYIDFPSTRNALTLVKRDNINGLFVLADTESDLSILELNEDTFLKKGSYKEEIVKFHKIDENCILAISKNLGQYFTL